MRLISEKCFGKIKVHGIWFTNSHSQCIKEKAAAGLYPQARVFEVNSLTVPANETLKKERVRWEEIENY